mmetsp:Transcript_3876/g.11986  ORF Transcript_3876/g.11986 Transcript_3876/m.11986 type:complete len:218 (-) Transcript_3876:1411-2064(-)
MPDDAFAELPPVRRSLSIRTTFAPASSSRSAAVSPATPVPTTSASGRPTAMDACTPRVEALPLPTALAPSMAKGVAGVCRAARRYCANRLELAKCFATRRMLVSCMRMRDTACASAPASSAPERAADATAPKAMSINSTTWAEVPMSAPAATPVGPSEDTPEAMSWTVLGDDSRRGMALRGGWTGLEGTEWAAGALFVPPLKVPPSIGAGSWARRSK